MDLVSPFCLLFYVLGIVELCGAASRNKRQRQTNQDYYYAQHQDTHPDYSYSQVESYDVEVEKTKCYDCDYRLYAKENRHEGFEECMDPFRGHGIVHEVECDGPCAKIYENKGENSFEIRRSCRPGCTDRSDEDGSYTECCTWSLCNGYSSSYVVKDQRWLLLTASVASLLVAKVLL